MHKLLQKILVPALMLAGAASVQATQLAVFDAPTSGMNSFNNTVSAAGGTAVHDTWTGLLSTSTTSLNRGDYTVTRNDGSSMYFQNYGNLSGQVTGFSAYDSNDGGKRSGLTLTFSSAINAVGFEVGDWGTCCQPSALYVSFDGGAPIMVGKSLTNGDAFFNNRAEVFVGAFDDAGSFTKVQFWGDGFGEALALGGTVHYALIPEDTLPPSDVPEPASLALIGLGLLGAGAARHKLRKQA